MTDTQTDYRNTLNLPETDFPMKANLPVREPEQVKTWLSQKTYEQIQEMNKSKPLFVMPDGPPYANGNIHVGHCLNKILKDIVIKYKSMAGFRSVFIPGWDCHGLPIEHAVAKELGNKRREKSDAEIRKLCREYASKYIDLQREQFKRLGILADWDHPYTTMDTPYEAAMIRSLARIYDAGHVYRGEKPVHWCWSDGTALAEAEVEYANRKDPSIYVKFEAAKNLDKLGNPKNKTYFVIWTTTPWTLPANLAISLNSEFDYGIYEVDGENWVLAKELAPALEKASGKSLKLTNTFKGSTLGGTKKVGDSFDGVVCRHPFIDRESYVLLGDHVTLDAGTGCVHTAPGHGQDDYQVGFKYGLQPYNPVNDWGKYTDKVPEYVGQKVFDVNPKVVQRLRESGHLIVEETLDHSFPHCWRCHNPVIFRATAQWFIAMDETEKNKSKGSIRKKALEEIKKVKWFPSWGENRITAMVENRPDWCISRQRLWGVPIPVFYCEKCQESEASAELMNKVALKVEKQGLESWYTSEASEFLGANHKCKCGHGVFKKGSDILDVWFDSGVCHSAVQETREGMSNPADLYLEGSDQHRGWFQSSLMTSIAMHGRAPFKNVLTHGFVNDAQGRKMSKSIGNVLDPHKFMEKNGAEILRLWTAYVDYSNDLQAGQESFDRVSESYRRVRNTCRYILGNISDFDPKKDSVDYEDLLDVDKWALSRLAKLIKTSTESYDKFEYHPIYHALQNYCTVELSAVYLDILKDRLYTFKKDGIERRAAQTTIYLILRNIVGIMAPITSFLSEEVYLRLPGHEKESIFLTDFPKADPKWFNQSLEQKWSKLFEARSVVTKQLEEARQGKMIGSGLEAKVELTVPVQHSDIFYDNAVELPSIFIVSQVKIKEGPEFSVKVEKADGEKCERCWNFSAQTNKDSKFPNICPKCVKALS
ncbi:MAG: isoleucine--tRNA ligase [Oligoflexia bacterium]|nr:isoleucine--tRNA ligase [Oligoflexia bacterium]